LNMMSLFNQDLSGACCPVYDWGLIYKKSLTAQTGSTDARGSWTPPQSHSLTGDRRMSSPAQGHASCRSSETTGLDLGGTLSQA